MVDGLSRLAGLTNGCQFVLFFLIKVIERTKKEPCGLFCRKTVQGGGCWNIGFHPATKWFEVGSQRPIGMRISLSFHLTPNLLNVMTSAIPSLLHIRSVRIETTPVGVMVVGFRILVRGKPALDSSCTQTNSLRDLLDLHPLLTQRHHVLVAIIPLSLVSRVGLSISGQKGQER